MKYIITIVLCLCVYGVAWGEQDELFRYDSKNKLSMVQITFDGCNKIKVERQVFNSNLGEDVEFVMDIEDLKYLFDHIDALKKVVEYTVLYDEAEKLQERVSGFTTKLRRR